MASGAETPPSDVVAATADEPLHLLDGSVRVLTLDSFRDDRGTLVPLTFGDVGFRAERAFVVTAPQGAVRGGHAHRRIRQVMLRASGAVELDLRWRGSSARLILDDARPAVLLEAGVWSQQTYISPDSALVVFADGPYDPAEYTDDDSGTEKGAS